MMGASPPSSLLTTSMTPTATAETTTTTTTATTRAATMPASSSQELHTNGSHTLNGSLSNGGASRKLLPISGGVYAPLPTPMNDNDELDEPALVKHALRLVEAGVGLVVSGSTGEAIALTMNERFQAIHSIRTALDERGYLDTPIIAGTGGGSSKETIFLCQEAQRAGADAVLVIAPGYFSMAIGKDREALREYFIDTADASPLPVLVYNFPAAAGGIDLDSDLLEELASHRNICGTKLTCAGVGKGGRVANCLSAKSKGEPFHVFAGYGDILFPSMMIGMTGAIVGTANLLPRLFATLYAHITQYLDSPSKELLRLIQEKQNMLSKADWALSKHGLAATKWALTRWYEPMGRPRRPLQPISKAAQAFLEENLGDAVRAERDLEAAARR